MKKKLLVVGLFGACPIGLVVGAWHQDGALQIPIVPDIPVKDFRISFEANSVEVEGICKLTETEAVCWKPNGQLNRALAEEIMQNAKESKDTSNSSFRLRLGSKNRLLVLKRVGEPYSPRMTPIMGSALTNNFGRSSDSDEKWQSAQNPFKTVGSIKPNLPRTDREVLVGSFKKDTKHFPLRYQYTHYLMKRTVVPFTKGPFTIEGNTYEILDSSDKPLNGGTSNNLTAWGNFSQKQIPISRAYVSIKILRVEDPNMIVNFTPADSSGMPYSGLNEKGEIQSNEDRDKQAKAIMDRLEEAKKSGTLINFYNRGVIPEVHIESAQLDSSNPYNVDRISGKTTLTFNVPLAAIKSLSVMVSKRTTYVFEGIALDPKGTK